MTKKPIDATKSTPPATSDQAVPRSRAIAATPATAPATTELVTATTPGAETNTWYRGIGPTSAMVLSRTPASSSYLLVTK